MFVREERVELKRTKSVETGTMCWERRLKDYRDWQVDVVYCLFTQSEERENSKKDNSREPGRRGDESQRLLRGDERIRKEGVPVIRWSPQDQRMGEQSANKKTRFDPNLNKSLALPMRLDAIKTKSEDKSEELEARRFFPFEMYLFCGILNNLNSLKLISPFNSSHAFHLIRNRPSWENWKANVFKEANNVL